MILEKKTKYSGYKTSRIGDTSTGIISDETREELHRLIALYRGGLRDVCARLEFLDDQFHIDYDHNPIHHMECRMKSVRSILEKVQRRGYPMTLDGIRDNVLDIAGVRVVCNYIDDVYHLAELITGQENFTVEKYTDYIKRPKENGYRSLHVVVRLPVQTARRVETVPVEIQLRTVAMDAWASLEHEMIYKSSHSAVELDRLKLKICADELAAVDNYMQEIYKEMN